MWSPRGLKAHKSAFRIAGAEQVRWDWFYYGRPKTSANRYFIEFKNEGDRITAATNVDWAEQNLQATMDAPAVEMF